MGSERISNEGLADVAHRVADGRCAVCLNGDTRSSCAACDGTGAFNLATDVMERILLELISLRASAVPTLTEEERRALRLLRLVVKDGVRRQSGDDYEGRLWPETALAVLDKLLAGAGGGGR